MLEDFILHNLGNIITIGIMLVGGITFLNRLNINMESQSKRLEAIEDELSELRKVMIALARQEERISAMDQRVLAHGKRVDAQGERITAMDQRLNDFLRIRYGNRPSASQENSDR